MLQAHSSLHAFLKKYVICSVLATAPVLAAGSAWADNSGKKVEPAVRLLSSVPIPVSAFNTEHGTFSFDISFVDQSDGTYYLADRSNKAVDALFAESIVTQIFPNNGHAPFAGISPPAFSTATAGPNGVVAAFPWLFVTDAPSRVLTFDLRQNPPLTVSEVTTLPGEPTRADELAYDPKDGLILAINNASTPPVATLVSVNQTTGALAVVKNIFLDTAPGHSGVDAQNGAEQPVWDPGTQKFFLSIPQLGPNPTQGAVIRISTTGTVETAFPIDFCSPAGLALGPHEDLLVGCNTIWATDGSLWTGNADTNTKTAAPQLVIINALTGKIETNVLGSGVGDEVWFNKGDNHYYAAASGSNLAPNALFPARTDPKTAPPLTAQGAATLDVIDALSETLDQRVPTLNVPTNPGVHPAGTAHSVAADADTNHVFVPIAANNAVPNCLTGCITINGRYDPDKD